jgi:TolB-like protein/cytochrome c-type biogenesis protein CcmH/NrfG
MADAGSRLQRWFGELRRRKVFRVAGVYLVAGWLAIQVADAVFEPLGLPAWSLKLVIVLAALGFPLACALAWAFDLTPGGIERTPAVSVEPPALPSAGMVPAAAPAGQALAILPFADLSPARDQEYFCDGIAEEIVNALCCVRGLRIASRTSAAQFKGRSVDVREIGKALGVGAVLEGSVRKAGEQVRINAQLVNTADGYHLWSESFDRRLQDVFATQTEIAQKLVRALRLTLTPQENELLERGGTRSAEAYDLYLRGQALLRDGSDTALPQAAALFRRAIDADPQFAQAHAGVANALAYAGIWGLDLDAASIDLALAASRRALELEPRMPEAFVAKGNLLFMQGRREEAFAAFEEAIRLNPSSYEAHYFYARDLFSAGRAQQAVAYYQAAERLRPEEFQPPCMLAGALFSLGRTEEGNAAARRAVHAIDARLAVAPDDSRALHLGAVLAARLGEREHSLAWLRRSLDLQPDEFATAYNAACTYAVLGMRDEALDTLDRAVRTGRGDLGWIEHDPDFESLRGERRFGEIVDRLRAKSERHGT